MTPHKFRLWARGTDITPAVEKCDECGKRKLVDRALEAPYDDCDFCVVELVMEQPVTLADLKDVVTFQVGITAVRECLADDDAVMVTVL